MNQSRKQITDSEARQIQLELLSSISDFCFEHQIKFSLSHGSLLGAVRHKGFIPWDDDIDLSMPRPDYDRFCKTYHAENSSVHWYRNDNSYIYPFAKVYSDKTTGCRSGFPKMRLAVHVDVFPLDGLPSNETKFKLLLCVRSLFASLLVLRNISFFRTDRPIGKQMTVCLASPLRIFPNRLYLGMLDWLFRRCRFETAQLVGCVISTATSAKNRMSASVYREISPVEFEGRSFPAFRDADTYLRSLYGDYMTPPPPQERIPSHDFCAFYWK